MAQRKNQARKIPPEDIRPDAPEVKRAIAFTGIFARVARNIGRNPAHVLEVAKGRRQSKPVLAAIISEVRSIESDTEHKDAA